MIKNFSAGIHVLVQKGGKYLALRRSDDDFTEPWAWDLPGGGIHFGEQPMDAALRETREEAGIEIALGKILDVRAAALQDRWSIEVLIEGVWKKGDVAVSREHSEYRWVSRDELLRLKPQSVHVKQCAVVLKKK